MPVMVETRRQIEDRISLFSGFEFNVDAEKGLKGVCDFLLSFSPLQLAVEAPDVAIVEAKNENVPRGIALCLAEMVAAQQYNREQENAIPLCSALSRRAAYGNSCTSPRPLHWFMIGSITSASRVR